MRFDKRPTNCPNCGKTIKTTAFTFQGVRICDDCATILKRTLAKAEEELNCVRSMYSEILRVALLKGELRLPAYPVPKDVSKADVMKELRKMAEQLGGGHAGRDPHEAPRSTEGEGEVHPLRDGTQDSRSVPPGNGVAAVPRGR